MDKAQAIRDFIAKYGNLSGLEGNHYRGSLDLEGTGITSLPDGLTVGGSLNLRGTGITITSKVRRDAPQMLRWEYKGREFIKVDGIFSQVVAHKGNVWHVRQIGSSEVQYLVTDGQGKWSHGETLQQAKEDLIYKISDRNPDKYRELSLESQLTLSEAIECYRVVTGACAAGTKMFVESLGGKVQERYTIAEMIEVTKGQYGHDRFCGFFKK